MDSQNEVVNEPGNESQLEDLFSMEGYDKPVRRARIFLFVIAAITLLPLFMMAGLSDAAKTINIAIIVFQSVVFIALAFWISSKPYYAIITALVFYTLMIVLYGLLNPGTIFQGFIWKIAVYCLLVVGLSNAKDVQRWKDSIKDRQ